MSNNKQSSIDYLISQLQKSKDWHRVLHEVSQMSSAKVDIIAEAKAMHKEEMIEFCYSWSHERADKIDITQDYNEIYGGNK
jgi:transcriptional regulator of heat shock response